jgi:hypothetical protein
MRDLFWVINIKNVDFKRSQCQKWWNNSNVTVSKFIKMIEQYLMDHFVKILLCLNKPFKVRTLDCQRRDRTYGILKIHLVKSLNGKCWQNYYLSFLIFWTFLNPIILMKQFSVKYHSTLWPSLQACRSETLNTIFFDANHHLPFLIAVLYLTAKVKLFLNWLEIRSTQKVTEFRKLFEKHVRALKFFARNYTCNKLYTFYMFCELVKWTVVVWNFFVLFCFDIYFWYLLLLVNL